MHEFETPGASTRQYLYQLVSFSDVELTTPQGVHWRKSTRKWPVSGPVLEGRGASGSAQGQISKRNHTPMNYKYCLVCACKGTSPLQRCHPRSAARQGWVCLSDIHCSRCPRSWSWHANLKLRVQTRQYL